MAIFLSALWIMSFGKAFANTPPAVLILNSYHKEFKWTDEQVDAAKRVLQREFTDIDIFVEYMDTKRVYTAPYLQALHDVYALKYSGIVFDAILTTDDNALQFAVKYRRELFNDAPISFCGINDFREDLINGASDITGIIEVLDIRPTIDLALTLHPLTRKVVVLVDSTPTGIGQLRDIRRAARQYPSLVFEYIEGRDNTHQQAFDKLQNLPQNAIVLLAVWLRDKNDEYLPAARGGKLISGYSPVPVYGIIDMYFGDGIVGGKLLNSKVHGTIAAEKAVMNMRSGKNIAIPVEKDSQNPFMFDYDQMSRWKIQMSDLPEGSIIIHRPFSFYSKYKFFVNAVGGAFFVMVLILSYLIMNIVRRQEAEKKLIRSEKLFRKIFQEHSAVKLLIDPETGYIIEANAAAAKFYGYSPSMMKQMKIQELNTLADTTAEHEMHKAKQELKNQFQFQHKLADGSTRDVDVFSSPIEVEGKRVLHSIVHDVTERKTAERRLTENETKFRKIFDLSPQAIALTESESGKLVAVNNRLCELTHYRKDDLIGRTTTALGFYSVEDRARFISELQAAGHVNSLEMTFRAKNGNHLTALMYATPINVADQNLILTIFADITDQKKLENQLSQAQKMESIGSLAGGIAHDFNNLLFPIIGMSEILLEDLPPDSPEHQSVQEIYKAGKRGSELVRQILSFSRQSEQRLIPIQIQRVIRDVLKLCRATIPTYIEITFDLEKECGFVMADPTQIHQIGMNLITNAFHAIGETEGTISVAVRTVEIEKDPSPDHHLSPGRYVSLSVTDTGTGISPDIIDRIFDPYFTTKGKDRGTGLGLSTVYGIVKKHNGEIMVHSEVGRGTAFSVYLPLVERTAIVDADSDRSSLPGGSETILLVDDEEPIANLEKHMLERLGYQVTVQTGSVEALALFRTDPASFDLIITDMNMPHMTGDLLAKEILSTRPEMPVIICTGFSERINEKGIESIGVKGLLMKPVVKSDMARMVRKVLDEVKK